MLIEEKHRRQELLNEKIRELSKSLLNEEDEEKVRAVVLQLKDIYSPDFRHNYSEFFPLILDIQRNTDGNTDFLVSNLQMIMNYAEADYVKGTKEFQDIYTQLNKLCDHLNLEISRMDYYSQNEKKMADLDGRIQDNSRIMQEAAGQLNQASQRADSLQTELLSILSIFAAIVFAFSGQLNVMSSAISAAGNTYICKSILLMLLGAVATFNTIFLMIYLVGKIIGRNIFVKCLRDDCEECCEYKKKCSGISKIKKRLPYVFYFNVVVMIFAAADVVVWCADKWLI